jgi:hypothetical protein
MAETQGALTPTGDLQKYIELRNELINHGWGEFHMFVSSLKDDTIKVEIKCGRTYIFFLKKNIFIDENKLL